MVIRQNTQKRDPCPGGEDCAPGSSTFGRIPNDHTGFCWRLQALKFRLALYSVYRNDRTEYEHHEPRPFDGQKPRSEGGTCWLTPKEIARRMIGEPPFPDVKVQE